VIAGLRVNTAARGVERFKDTHGTVCTEHVNRTSPSQVPVGTDEPLHGDLRRPQLNRLGVHGRHDSDEAEGIIRREWCTRTSAAYSLGGTSPKVARPDSPGGVTSIAPAYWRHR
jgi:hypothetical protein